MTRKSTSWRSWKASSLGKILRCSWRYSLVQARTVACLLFLSARTSPFWFGRNAADYRQNGFFDEIGKVRLGVDYFSLFICRDLGQKVSNHFKLAFVHIFRFISASIGANPILVTCNCLFRHMFRFVCCRRGGMRLLVRIQLPVSILPCNPKSYKSSLPYHRLFGL